MTETKNKGGRPAGGAFVPRIGRLTTVMEVAAELGRLYKHARKKELDVSEGAKLANILKVLKECLEASQLEQRLVAMESALASAGANVVPFGKRKA